MPDTVPSHSSSSRVPGPRRGTPHAPASDRHDQIVQAALLCFAEDGYERATVDSVAARAGLSKGSVYRFFPSKDALLLAVFEVIERIVLDTLMAGGDDEPVLDRLGKAGAQAIELVRGGGDLGKAWLEFVAHPQGRERMARLYAEGRARLAVLVREGMRRGQLRRASADDVAAALMGLIEGVILQAIIDPAFDAGRCWPGIWRSFSEGIGAKERNAN